jgi:hypothetical protein
VREEPTLTAQEELARMDALITDLTGHRRELARQFAERKRQLLSSENSAGHGPWFPAWTGEARDAILQPPKPQIEPSARILERVTGHDLDLEAAD